MDNHSNKSVTTETTKLETSRTSTIDLNRRSTASLVTGLRRQPTKYPHGLNITVQTLDQDCTQNYSRASTLRSNDSRDSNASSWPPSIANTSLESLQQKYRISMVGGPETLAELQVRRYKYPLTANYYLNAQDATQTPIVLLEYAKRLCRWKYLRWPIIFLASVLLFFGLITYCLWLHDVSIARQKYIQRRLEGTSEYVNELLEDYQPTATASTVELTITQKSITTMTTNGGNSANFLYESTRLRPIDTKGDKPTKQTTPHSIPTTEHNFYDDYDTLPSDDDDRLEPADSIRFTSGHQNSFGVPIEQDERILRILKGLYPSEASSTLSTTSMPHTQARVSPTIPPPVAAVSKPTAAMTTPQESGCFSTTLPMCRGVLDYDLTYNASTHLKESAQAEYDKLFNSNCSARAIEFVCAALEPECRPLHIGQLPPCRRICKAVLEACSIIIVNSDTLTELFDCSLYPDSSDPHKCEDPTRRRDYCYDNEFECYDSTCIPYQWQCDNIKDCATGEDEEECLVCAQPDEFRCRSNEKCVSDAARCDLKYDCFDGSDEEDCEDYGSGDDTGFDESELNAFPRIFSYASFLSPNQTNEKLYTYITATTDDETGTKFQVHEITNRTIGISQEEVTNSVPGEGPKGLVNFRDSKEIMMTSDSENKFKYSAARANRTANKASNSTTTPLRAAASNKIAVTTTAPSIRVSGSTNTGSCAPHQLRCISGKCITVSQLCDKHVDCPDGADERMCVYKERSTPRRNNNFTTTSMSTTTTSTTTTTISTASTTTLAPTNNNRTLRTTIKRKPKS